MAHHNTVFAQMLKFIQTCLSRPGHEFESLAHQYHAGRRLRKMTRWTQFFGHGHCSIVRSPQNSLTSRVTMTFCASGLGLKRGSGERGAQLRDKAPLE